jgi:DeoR/GlpR family transcriptional regulator of sugar metabolism
MLKEERQRRILDIVETEGRVVAAHLQDVFGVSGYTVRRDLDELAQARRLQRVHGGALARSTVPVTYEERQTHALAGKIATAKAAARLLRPGQVVILDGGSTALQIVEHVQRGTFITHSPPVAAALAARPGVEVIVVGGTLDPRALVATGAETIRAYRNISADICFLGVWALHAEHGLSGGYYEESEVRRTMLERAETVVGLASHEKLDTVAPFKYGPVSALTHLATDAPPEATGPFEQLGIEILR